MDAEAKPLPPPETEVTDHDEAMFRGYSGDGAGLRITWPLARADGQRAQLEVYFDDDDPGQVVEVRYRHPEGLTPTKLQRFAWARWIAVAQADYRYYRGDYWPSEADAVLEASQRATDAALAGRRPPRSEVAGRPGRRGHPDEHYAKVAALYRELRRSGVRNPTATIAQRYVVSRSTAAGWVAGARRRHMLPPARQGRAG